MKKIAFAGLAGILFLCMGSCYKYVAEHPEKSKTQFYEDQQACEEQAREYAVSMRGGWSGNDDYSDGRNVNNEISDVRRCMRDKGWNYHFRK